MISYFKVFVIGLKQIKKWVIDEDHFYLAIYIISFSFAIPYWLIQRNDLNQRTAFAVGIITKIEIAGKTPHKAYEFYIGNKTYRGRTGIGGLTKIEVGDSVIVAYEYTNPNNEELYCYFEYTLDRSKLPDTVFYRRLIDNFRRPLK